MIEQHRITHIHMVPIMFNRLLKLPDDVKKKYDLSSLEMVVHAAAPCPAPLVRSPSFFSSSAMRRFAASSSARIRTANNGSALRAT